ncbi:MAG: hypothetical protein OCD00_01390 [Colwellia sp.]
MNNSSSINMTLHILTSGWILRVFILFLWLIALVARFFVDEDNIIVVGLVIVFANLLLYLTASNRLILLTRSSMSSVLPHYWGNIKKALFIMLLVSFIPATIMLPYFTLWLALLSLSMLLAIIFVAMIYQPKLYYAFLVLFFMPYLTKVLVGDIPFIYFEHIDFYLLLAWISPVIALYAYQLLNKLETFKGDAKHQERILELMNLNMRQMLTAQNEVSFKSRNKVMQWLINSNYDSKRLLIKASRKMSNLQLISTACQSITSIGKYTYIFWAGVVVLFLLLLHFGSSDYQYFFIPFSIMFPAMMVGSGTLVLFQAINNKKTLLKRLSIMPCFVNKHSFTMAFLSYIITYQLKLYTFVLVIIALLVNALEHVSWAMYLNLFLATSLLCFFNISLMLLSWSGRRAYGGVFIWLMLIAFIICVVFVMVVSSDASIALIESNIFGCFLLVCTTLFSLSLYRSYQRLPYFSE